jgi:hypothetical protein
MNKEGKLEACSILAQEYATIAKSSGFASDEVYSNYMDRCMGRDNEVVAEQVMREAYNKMRTDPSLSWVTEWNKEKQARQAVEAKYNALTTKIKQEAIDRTDGDKYLMNYARSLNFL